jgi:hypothetical protein
MTEEETPIGPQKNLGNLPLFVFQVSYQKRLISVNSKSCLKSANYRSTTLNPRNLYLLPGFLNTNEKIGALSKKI